MRTKLIIPALLAMLVVGAAQAFAQTATVVTHSGQRIRGQLVDMGNYGSLTVRAYGRDREIPMDDVMMIDFVGDGRNMPQRELAAANQSDGLVVLRSGRTLNGRLVDMQPYANQAVISGGFGERNVPLNQVARIYFGANNGYGDDQYGNRQSGPYNNGYDPYYNPNSDNTVNYGQYGNPQYGNPQYGQPVYGNGLNRTVTVPTNQQWTNVGINVQRGETIHFRASGNVTLSENEGDFGTPAGANNGRLAGNSPLPGVTGGMLIGRVGNGQPFAIGAESDVTMPASGRLYLGINDDYVRDNTGNFIVEMWDR